VKLAGQNAATPYWWVKNSWATDWGDYGYIKMRKVNDEWRSLLENNDNWPHCIVFLSNRLRPQLMNGRTCVVSVPWPLNHMLKALLIHSISNTAGELFLSFFGCLIIIMMVDGKVEMFLPQLPYLSGLPVCQ
jgi:hypothetical protein